MEVKYNNAAGRLLAIFTEAEKQSPNEKTYRVWQKVLGLPVGPTAQDPRPDEVALIFSQLAPMFAGLDEVDESICQVRPEAAHLYVKNFVSLKIALTPTNLTLPWNQTKVHITAVALHQLEMCANDLPQEGEVTEDELAQISEAVNELFDQVKDSEIENSLKTWILELLSAIKKSIDNYFIFGAKDLGRTFSMLVGEIQIYSETLNHVKQQDATIFQKFGQIFGQVHGVLIKAKVWWPLLKGGGKMLGLPFDDGEAGDAVS